MAQRLQGEVALVTGGGRGIGRAVAIEYAKQGAAVAVMSRTPAEVDEAVAAITAAGGRAIGISGAAGDVSDLAAMKAAIERIERELGPISILLNNAGNTGPYGPMWEIDPEAWWQTQQIHVGGSFFLTNLIVRGMVERGRGRVLTMTSNAGREAVPNFSGYGVAKAAQIRMMETLAQEAGEHGVIAFAVSPGLVYTELAESTVNDPGAQRWMRWFVDALIEEKKLNRADEGLAIISELCVTLASGDADALAGGHFDPTNDMAAEIAAAGAR